MGCPMQIDTSVVPPTIYHPTLPEPNCPMKHRISDSIHVMFSFRLLFLTLSHTKREAQYTISDIHRNTRMNRMLSI